MKIISVILLSAFVLTGCNTVSGIGQDMKKAGEAVGKSSEKVREKL